MRGIETMRLPRRMQDLQSCQLYCRRGPAILAVLRGKRQILGQLTHGDVQLLRIEKGTRLIGAQINLENLMVTHGSHTL